jgi:hypothetical protein
MFPWEYGNSFLNVSGGIWYPIGDQTGGTPGSPVPGIGGQIVYTDQNRPYYPPYVSSYPYPTYGGTNSNLLLILIVVVAAILILK